MDAADDTRAGRKVTDGARDLRAYLTAQGLSITAFCEQKHLDRVQVQRVLNGERGKRITVDFADAIARATNGEVPITAWCSKVVSEPESSPSLDDDPKTDLGD